MDPRVFPLHLHAHVGLVINNEELFSQAKEDHHERKGKRNTEITKMIVFAENLELRQLTPLTK